MGWFSGSAEGHDGVAIVYAQLNSTTAAAPAGWSAANVISQRKGYSNQNAVLFAQPDTLHAFHSQQGGGAGESKATVWHLSAPLDQEGRAGAFSKPVEVFSEPGSFDKNRVLVRLDGSWLLPIYEQGTTPNQPRNKFLPKGADPDDAKAWSDGKYENGDNLVQPSVVRPKPGAPGLLAFFRDRKSRNIYSATSADDGASWTPSKPTSLPNNNAGIHAFAMRSGRIALAYNPTTHSRDTLSISLSEDQGKTWKYTRVLEQGSGGEFSYPTIREDVARDGVIHASYTFKRQCIKHSVISEAWIMQGDR